MFWLRTSCPRCNSRGGEKKFRRQPEIKRQNNQDVRTGDGTAHAPADASRQEKKALGVNYLPVGRLDHWQKPDVYTYK